MLTITNGPLRNQDFKLRGQSTRKKNTHTKNLNKHSYSINHGFKKGTGLAGSIDSTGDWTLIWSCYAKNRKVDKNQE